MTQRPPDAVALELMTPDASRFSCVNPDLTQHRLRFDPDRWRKKQLTLFRDGRLPCLDLEHLRNFDQGH